jgi:hypothetical protein
MKLPVFLIGSKSLLIGSKSQNTENYFALAKMILLSMVRTLALTRWLGIL